MKKIILLLFLYPILLHAQISVTGAAMLNFTNSTDLNSALTVTGIRGVSVPSLTSGVLKYNGSAWTFDNTSYLSTSTAASTYVPYSGATGAVNLGSYGITANSFSGAGTGLTGTASGLSIGGNAATATVAANYLPLTGGTLTGNIIISPTGNANIIVSKPSTSTYASYHLQTNGVDDWQIYTSSEATPSLRFNSAGVDRLVISSTGATTLSGPLTGTSATFTSLPTGSSSDNVVTVDGSGNLHQVAQTTLSSGTYTPTITTVTNVASTNAYQCQYMRVGNTVTVSGYLIITPTLGVTTLTQIRISLPITSNFVATENAGGAGGAQLSGLALMPCSIYAIGSSSLVGLQYTAMSTSASGFNFTFTYQIL